MYVNICKYFIDELDGMMVYMLHKLKLDGRVMAAVMQSFSI